MPTRIEAGFSELFDQAFDTFTDALKSGAKFQEDVVRWWTGALGHTNPMQDWQKRSQAIMAEAVPAAQRSADEYLKLFDHGYRTSIDLFKRAVQSTPPKSLSEAQMKAQELFEESMAALRTSAQGMAEANLRAIESWAEWTRAGANMARESADVARQTAKAAVA
ncbi:MAG TPA: hypothetical protein VGI81_18700 [Tepidisphaeraceae bacterium]|jgi:hypothetical protein